VCDGLSAEGELIEVQTGSFGPLKGKVKELSARGRIRIIHPIILKKTIELYDTAGRLLRRRLSPRKGSPWDLFKALRYAPLLPASPNLTIELALVEETERRVDDGQGSWRRRGVSIADKDLSALHTGERIVLKTPRDYRRFLPFRRGEKFGSKDLAAKAGISLRIAQNTLYVLEKLALAKRVGKQGRAWVYTRG
jgi:hypothetical protein